MYLTVTAASLFITERTMAQTVFRIFRQFFTIRTKIFVPFFQAAV